METLDFDQFVDLLRERIGAADAIKDGSELHSFKELMADYDEGTPSQWYWDALEELEAQGHLHAASTVFNGGDAGARLSADGRLFLRTVGAAD